MKVNEVAPKEPSARPVQSVLQMLRGRLLSSVNLDRKCLYFSCSVLPIEKISGKNIYSKYIYIGDECFSS